MLTKPFFKFVTILCPWSGASCAGCVLQARDASLERNTIKMDTWPRDAAFKHGMRPLSIGCVLGARDKSGKFLMRLFLSPLSPPIFHTRDNPEFEFIGTAMHLTFLTRNPINRVSIYYDHLLAFVYYQTHPITPTLMLPPLHHETDSTVAVSPVWPVSPVVFNGLVTDKLGR
ncbi:putative protein NDR1 [Helianthus debilis subsp. tardiflorus]